MALYDDGGTMTGYFVQTADATRGVASEVEVADLADAIAMAEETFGAYVVNGDGDIVYDPDNGGMVAAPTDGRIG